MKPIPWVRQLWPCVWLGHCTLPSAHHFPARNRLIAALSKKCYVIEAKSKSGTMITANYALSLNREIIVFPYRYDDIFGKGCNELIEQGASIFIP